MPSAVKTRTRILATMALCRGVGPAPSRSSSRNRCRQRPAGKARPALDVGQRRGVSPHGGRQGFPGRWRRRAHARHAQHGIRINGGVVVPRNRSAILSPEVYFSRGTRGTRTDVVTVYDPRKLRPWPRSASRRSAEATCRCPPGALTDDDRFLVIYNFTPAQTVSVVDVKARKFVGEIDIAGCALVYPTGPRSFFSLCGDGTALAVRLDDAGKAAGKARTPKLFDAVKDPVTEKGVRAATPGTSSASAATWCRSKPRPPARRRRALVAARCGRPEGVVAAGWHAAPVGARRHGRLYSLMHVGGEYTHKDPGTEVWVYDLAAASAGSADRAQGSGHVHQHHAGRQAGAVRDLHRRAEGRRLRPEGRQAAAVDRRDRVHAHDAGLLLSQPCTRSTPSFPRSSPSASRCCSAPPRCTSSRTGRGFARRSATIVCSPIAGPGRRRRGGALEIAAATLLFTACGTPARCSPPRCSRLRDCHRRQPARGRTSIDCGCLGAGRARRIGGWMVMRNLVLAAACCSQRFRAVRRPRRARRRDHRRGGAGPRGALRRTERAHPRRTSSGASRDRRRLDRDCRALGRGRRSRARRARARTTDRHPARAAAAGRSAAVGPGPGSGRRRPSSRSAT